MKTINIKGSEYVMVNERVKAFHELYPNGYIQTEIVDFNDERVYMRAVVVPNAEDPLRSFTGYSFEEKANGFINKTSFIENCETSAVGRALGFLGIGIDASIATADEVANAILNQTSQQATEKQLKTIRIMANDEQLLEITKKKPLPQLTKDEASKAIDWLKKKGE